MLPPFTSQVSSSAQRSLRCALIALGLATAGCACFQPSGPLCPWCPCCPQIDPTGDNLFIWPNQQPAAVIVPPPATVPYMGPPVGPPPATTFPPAPIFAPTLPPVPPPTGNLQAPPVFPDASPAAPVAPPVVTLPAAPTSFTAPTGAAVPVVAQSAAVPPPGAIPVGQDHLRITPDRLLAPVGSEVVLRAGICSAEGHLLRDRRVEWLLDSCGPGKFVDVAERDRLDLFRWVWDTPRKNDNNFVVGATSGQAELLSRGTADPSDDIPIADGEAWVSVTSASEGTSRITAYAPSVENWQFRQASATIYWVDAQWVFPPPAIVEPGRPHVLTTTVTRRTDGSPLVGWIVRYESASGASLGYGGGSFVDVPTDANGRASVEVNSAGSPGGSTTVGITVSRPPQAAPDSTPSLEIGRGATLITWGAAPTAASPLPPPPVQPPAVPGTMPAPSLPSTPDGPSYPFTPGGVAPAPTAPQLEPTPATTQPDTIGSGDGYSPPPNEAAVGKPQLEVTLSRQGTQPIAVGDNVSFEVVVRNRGTGTARNISIRDSFDRGLSHLSAKPNEYAIDYQGMRELGPGETSSVNLTFKVEAAGQHCHHLTVSAENAESVTKSACISTQPTTIDVTYRGPTRRIVGETAEFVTTLRNTGEVAATNLEAVWRFDAALRPTDAEPGFQLLEDGSILLRIERLEVGKSLSLRMLARCDGPGNSVCSSVTVTANGQMLPGQEACTEVLPQLSSGGVLGNPPATTPPALQVLIATTPNPARTGEPAQIVVTVLNTTQQTAAQVTLGILLPTGMSPVESQIQPAGAFVVNGQELSFQAATALAPNQQITYTIPVTPNRAGTARVQVQVTAAGLSAPIRAESPMSILSGSL